MSPVMAQLVGMPLKIFPKLIEFLVIIAVCLTDTPSDFWSSPIISEKCRWILSKSAFG